MNQFVVVFAAALKRMKIFVFRSRLGYTQMSSFSFHHQMEVYYPPFDPSTYKVDLAFFGAHEDTHLSMLERDEIVAKINEIVDREFNNQKYMPIVLSTSRGMGKTFLLKKFGLQQVKEELKCVGVEEAIAGGCLLQRTDKCISEKGLHD